MNKLMLQWVTPLLFSTLFFNVSMAQVSGTFTVVKGDIQIQSADGKSEKARVGKKVFPKDTIIAGTDARAKIVMSDQNVLNISPETKMVLEKYINDEATGDKQVSLNVLYGKVRATVEQKYDGEKNQFQVKTPAAVAGVRGTDFITSFAPKTQQTKIITFEGQVAVGQFSGGQIINPVLVSPGQFTTVTSGQVPTPPTALPKVEFDLENQGSQAEVSAAPPQAAPAKDNNAKSDEKGDNKNSDSQAKSNRPQKTPAASAGSREPASLPAGAGLITREDIGGVSAPIPSSPLLAPVVVNPCAVTFCAPPAQVNIPTGPSRLNIDVQINK